jgi:hypothetical protein
MANIDFPLETIVSHTTTILHLFIGFSFVVIAGTLYVWFRKRRDDIDFPGLTILFFNFIFWCGISRILMAAEWYLGGRMWISTIIANAITAASSIAMAFAMPVMIRYLLAAPTMKEFETANTELDEFIMRLENKRVHAEVAGELLEKRANEIGLEDTEIRRFISVLRSSSARN